MTTIAYHHKSKTIATDSRVTVHDCIVSDDAIKCLEENGEKWFLSGDYADYKELAFKPHNFRFDDIDNIPSCFGFCAKESKVYYVVVTSKGYVKYSELFYSEAVVSGSEYALSAMRLGKSAQEAVEHALTIDSKSGGQVRVYKL